MNKETENTPIQIPAPESPEPKSYAEWLAKFYPTDAKEFIPSEGEYVYFFSEYGENDKIPLAQKAQEISALKHSIRKWEGLRPEVLREYKVKYTRSGGVSSVHSEDAQLVALKWPETLPLVIDSTSCALCALKSVNCEDCSIGSYLASTGEMQIPVDELDCLGQFGEMLRNKNPEPMISLLNETLKWVEGLEIKND